MGTGLIGLLSFVLCPLSLAHDCHLYSFPATKRAARTGFTFLEIIIVVLILGIVAMVALPQMAASVTDARLYAACSEVTAALEFAQMAAISTGRACRVTINATTDVLSVDQIVYTGLSDILNAAMGQLNASVVESATTYATLKYPMKPGADYTINFATDSRFGGANIVSAPFGAGNNVVFDGSGKPSAGGQIALAYGGRQAVISVDSATGKVTRTT